ncbi:OLC1v1034261C1 [Oldenlandia corymbosa var. corymbosa]|uniref:OLC1v1034261C1 n=1 Tax=Oldenlandia corymbosa var. corymbosa TaxID=529605 RepID=A0AAV1CQ41_OLDCO|nr:OLC1v1034261C1 [Oldenlandia corymbosa var. corymbosa]
MSGRIQAAAAVAETVSWYCALLLAVMLVLSCCDSADNEFDHHRQFHRNDEVVMLTRERPCDEIYVVREGETLHTISEKCGDPFIVEENPHIHDPDDVFPGLVIKITPFKHS